MRVADATAHQHAHEGRLVLFCSAGCLGKFKANPARYLAPLQPAAETVPERPAPAGTIYTCPMHPEIRQDHPG